MTVKKKIKDIYIEESKKRFGVPPQIGRGWSMVFRAIEIYVESKMDQNKKPVSVTLESGCVNIPERPLIKNKE